MKADPKITEDEMISALNRSGYLLESDTARTLAKAGFFIESNQVIEDPITGKSREIDLVAEYYAFKKERADLRTYSQVTFVFEIKNNLFPLVLLTRFEFPPSIEDWMGLKEALTIPDNLKYDWIDGYYQKIILNEIYTQYCSFSRKKQSDQLMALHPDNIHEGLSKITYYCEQMVKHYDKELIYPKSKSSKKEVAFRHFLFMPVLLINKDLFELRENKLKKVDYSVLVHNYHFDKERKMAYVFVVTKKGFPAFMNGMIKLQEAVGDRMFQIRKKMNA